ncbi:unnamed protein product [Linum trigynum]|uniref:Uncharacterized protein n=1 Tax=Linum trigynum TaxID=586398 RepID=A0AAV2CYB5_9ROSI
MHLILFIYFPPTFLFCAARIGHGRERKAAKWRERQRWWKRGERRQQWRERKETSTAVMERGKGDRDGVTSLEREKADLASLSRNLRRERQWWRESVDNDGERGGATMERERVGGGDDG